MEKEMKEDILEMLGAKFIQNEYVLLTRIKHTFCKFHLYKSIELNVLSDVWESQLNNTETTAHPYELQLVTNDLSFFLSSMCFIQCSMRFRSDQRTSIRRNFKLTSCFLLWKKCLFSAFTKFFLFVVCILHSKIYFAQGALVRYLISLQG